MTTVVLLPGMDGTGELFRFLIPHLPTSLDALVVRYPTDQPLGYEELAEHVLAKLPPEGPVVILGESFSGPVAISLAARRPPLALVLVCSFVRSPWPTLRPLRSLMRWLPSPNRFARPLASGLLGRKPDPAVRVAFTAALSAVDTAVVRHRAKQALGADVEAALARVRCPVLYVRATNDRVVPPRCADDVVRFAPQAKVVSIEGPHLLLQTRPEACAGAIADWVDRIHSV